MGPGQDGKHADLSAPLSRSDRVTWAAIVMGLFMVYNANFRDGGSLDAAASTLMPASILGEANFDLDEFRTLIAAQPAWFAKGVFTFGSMQERNGHLLSSYPFGGALLATPVYALPFALGWLNDYHAFRVAGKISASLMVALSAGFLFGTLRRQLSRRAAVALTLGYGLGTTAWSVASQGMWQHGPGMLCLSAALFFLVRLEENDRAVDAALAGAALGFAVVCRTTNLSPAAALALFVLVRHRRRLLPFAVPAALLGGWLVWYNLTTYGDLAGGYRAIPSSIYASGIPAWRGVDSNLFTNPLGYGLASILLAPSKGLLIYSPHLVFGLVGATVFWRRKGGPLTPYLALWVVLSLVWLAKFRLWWGGTAYGPRYLSEATLPLVLVIASLWPVIRARRLLFAAFAATLLLSVGIHFVGAFFAPCGWQENPIWADYLPERHWNWRDPEILRCLSQGLKNGPLPFELLHPGT